jgi:hypothetical protein
VEDAGGCVVTVADIVSVVDPGLEEVTDNEPEEHPSPAVTVTGTLTVDITVVVAQEVTVDTAGHCEVEVTVDESFVPVPVVSLDPELDEVEDGPPEIVVVAVPPGRPHSSRL